MTPSRYALIAAAGVVCLVSGALWLKSEAQVTSALRAGTGGVLCGVTFSRENPGLGLTSRAQWRCENGRRHLEANGIPDHATGVFPNDHNPSYIREQTVRFETTTAPVATKRTEIDHVIGFALNGVKFDPATAGTCPSGASTTTQCTPLGFIGPWSLEAKGGGFDFGVDVNNAHVQPDGAYHYHGIPEGLMTRGKTLTLVGWAIDGFPIYARYGLSDPRDLHSLVKIMHSSYRLKAAPDKDRPSVAILPMGTFTQDYEYAASSGDLDECNGRFEVTPEFPNGIYHYYVTDTWPYVQRCVKGAPTMGHGPPDAPGFAPPERRP